MTFPRLTWTGLGVLVLTLTACAAEPANPSSPGSTVASLELDDAVIAQTLAFLNDSETDFERLDVDCGFYSNAARQTIKHRNGRDREYPSADDDRFDTWEEFASVAGVGPAHEERAVECAALFGYVACASSESETIDYYDDLPVELQGFVDTEVDPSFRFYEAQIESACGSVTGYRVRVGRIIDPEGGIAETIDYTLAPDLTILDEFWDAG